jgi:hypothetical protein
MKIHSQLTPHKKCQRNFKKIILQILAITQRVLKRPKTKIALQFLTKKSNIKTTRKMIGWIPTFFGGCNPYKGFF